MVYINYLQEIFQFITEMFNRKEFF